MRKPLVHARFVLQHVDSTNRPLAHARFSPSQSPQGPGDPAVAVSAGRLPGGDVVERLTCDPGDLAVLAGHADVRIGVRTM